jgi:hypothetical protein
MGNKTKYTLTTIAFTAVFVHAPYGPELNSRHLLNVYFYFSIVLYTEKDVSDSIDWIDILSFHGAIF